MGMDRSLDQEGIPDLEGPLAEKVMTGDPQEGTPPPTDRPASLDYGVTAEEQMSPEPVDVRLARELPDIGALPRSPTTSPSSSWCRETTTSTTSTTRRTWSGAGSNRAAR